jgi:hypothetical protein
MNEETSFEAFAQEFEMKVIKQMKFELICSAVIPAISCLVAVERVIDMTSQEVKFDLHFFYWHAYLQKTSKPDDNPHARPLFDQILRYKQEASELSTKPTPSRFV